MKTHPVNKTIITFEKRKSSVDFQAQTNHADESVGYAIFTLHKLITLKHQYGRCEFYVHIQGPKKKSPSKNKKSPSKKKKVAAPKKKSPSKNKKVAVQKKKVAASKKKSPRRKKGAA